ncbi:hypothetical protein IMG5_181980 [Ichthyophthirius multifiliis]|uniref:Uncharacterized protein n=1 Tax=Ichthyophthirius multifiliis TaxID=5932 RepID=G0R2Z1_ICHMU|nr:hypothetical protein IMG5_181980 [Ichthyophthirius multifiliis]EGR28151.1 hypothetical protein IMG5_181980 [Ichthyophthirius multifiliis]|eukprot:XP_004027496.1 hypothetical protein IMG5_181980 [Ichthyophthirius multifiliis]
MFLHNSQQNNKLINYFELQKQDDEEEIEQFKNQGLFENNPFQNFQYNQFNTNYDQYEKIYNQKISEYQRLIINQDNTQYPLRYSQINIQSVEDFNFLENNNNNEFLQQDNQELDFQLTTTSQQSINYKILEINQTNIQKTAEEKLKNIPNEKIIQKKEKQLNIKKRKQQDNKYLNQFNSSTVKKTKKSTNYNLNSNYTVKKDQVQENNDLQIQNFKEIIQKLPNAYLPFTNNQQTEQQTLQYLKKWHNVQQNSIQDIKLLLPDNYQQIFEININTILRNIFILNGVCTNNKKRHFFYNSFYKMTNEKLEKYRKKKKKCRKQINIKLLKYQKKKENKLIIKMLQKKIH